MMKKRKWKGSTKRMVNSLFISFPRRPNLKRKVFQIKKKNQKIKQKCMITCSLEFEVRTVFITYPNIA